MVFKLLRSKLGGKVLYKSKKRRFTTMISHANSNESNNFNTSNSDNGTLNTNLLLIKVKNEIPLIHSVLF